MVGRIGVDAAKQFRGSLEFVTANADTHNVAVPIACRELENSLGFFDSEVARRIEDPQQRHTKIARATGPSAFETLEDNREILLAEQANAHRDIHLRVQHVLFFQSLHQAVGNELVVVRAAQVRADGLEGHQETLKIGVSVKRLDFGEGRVVAMEFPKFEQRSRFDRALQVQVQLRLWKLTDESIGRAERYGSHPFNCRFLTEDLREWGELIPTIFPLQFAVLIDRKRSC